jgi:hypothetical protein
MKNLHIERLRELRNESYNIAITKLMELAPKGSSWLRNEQSKDNFDDLNDVKLLLNQFHYGVEAKNELLAKCVELGWIKID